MVKNPEDKAVIELFRTLKFDGELKRDYSLEPLKEKALDQSYQSNETTDKSEHLTA